MLEWLNEGLEGLESLVFGGKRCPLSNSNFRLELLLVGGTSLSGRVEFLVLV
jgi:hypothetical protein